MVKSRHYGTCISKMVRNKRFGRKEISLMKELITFAARAESSIFPHCYNVRKKITKGRNLLHSRIVVVERDYHFLVC